MRTMLEPDGRRPSNLVLARIGKPSRKGPPIPQIGMGVVPPSNLYINAIVAKEYGVRNTLPTGGVAYRTRSR